MSASKKRQTMAKMQRERAVKEKRQLKREKKQAAAELRLLKASGQYIEPNEAGENLESGETVEAAPDGSTNGGVPLPAPAPAGSPADA